MLVEQGLLDLPILYLSRYVIRNTAAYYEGLSDVTRHGAWERWILYMLRATGESAQWTLAKITAVRELSSTRQCMSAGSRPNSTVVS